GAVIVPGLIFWLGLGGIKRSIDFKGGTQLTVPFVSRHSAGQIASALASVDPKYKDSRIVVAGGGGTGAQIAYVTTEHLTDAARDNVINAITQKVGPLVPGAKVAYADVSGTISKELTINAIKAVVFASIVIVLYLAVRFAIGGFVEGLKYGTCAVIALLHDVLVVWGSFAILGYFLNWQIDSLFVTAMLTVIGFSVHDTIIVFDRIRENLQHRERGETFSDLADRSIDQTIARSINTSVTVLITLLALFLFGGSIIHQFAAALVIGIISGTYSSIFNASVLLVMWKQRDAALAPATGPVPGRSAAPRSLPGDRPLVTAPTTEPAPAKSGGDQPPRPRPTRTTPRRQPDRRRRM
ncbi:MAG TPA: protein translocase subunit SecF, partial [Chthonomonadales bacterium]|nr:protein translocase subunit SecF [Chthonomonadales bacterium]